MVPRVPARGSQSSIPPPALRGGRIQVIGVPMHGGAVTRPSSEWGGHPTAPSPSTDAPLAYPPSTGYPEPQNVARPAERQGTPNTSDYQPQDSTPPPTGNTPALTGQQAPMGAQAPPPPRQTLDTPNTGLARLLGMSLEYRLSAIRKLNENRTLLKPDYYVWTSGLHRIESLAELANEPASNQRMHPLDADMTLIEEGIVVLAPRVSGLLLPLFDRIPASNMNCFKLVIMTADGDSADRATLVDCVIREPSSGEVQNLGPTDLCLVELMYSLSTGVNVYFHPYEMTLGRIELHLADANNPPLWPPRFLQHQGLVKEAEDLASYRQGVVALGATQYLAIPRLGEGAPSIPGHHTARPPVTSTTSTTEREQSSVYSVSKCAIS